ncbi:MAG: thiamine-monophosphate kinase [Pirellulales bacterium]
MESDFIAWLRDRLPSHARLRLGPGDDAGILRLGDRAECVVTTDLLTDQVDFDLATADPRRVGRKALAVNLSDLAAMAAQPVGAVIALAFPRNGGWTLAKSLYEGLLPLAEEFDLPIAGGDTNTWDGPLVISVTAIGQTTSRGPLCRGGAHPGDAIVVTGEFGGSILGRHFDFTPRVREALLLHEKYELHAGMDVSDGLSLDLGRLCDESRCGALLDLASIPISAAARQLAGKHRAAEVGTGQTASDHALADGEDFELILAVPPDEAQRMIVERPTEVSLTIIGQFVAEPGLWTTTSAGRQPLPRRGYQHRMTE